MKRTTNVRRFAIHQANPRRLPIQLELGHHHETVALTCSIPHELQTTVEQQLFAQYPDRKIDFLRFRRFRFALARSSALGRRAASPARRVAGGRVVEASALNVRRSAVVNLFELVDRRSLPTSRTRNSEIAGDGAVAAFQYQANVVVGEAVHAENGRVLRSRRRWPPGEFGDKSVRAGADAGVEVNQEEIGCPEVARHALP